MTNLPAWLNFEHVWLPYTQMQTAPIPVAIAEAKGARLKTCDGRELIDGVASWWTACHGYGHPHIIKSVAQQLERMPHVMFGGLAHEPAYKLAARLAALLPGDLNHVFLSESGSVAVEVALKMSAQFWLNQGEKRTKFVHFRNAYHGDTFATMALCDPDEGMHKLFSGILPENILAEVPDHPERLMALEHLLRDRHSEIAAVMIEPLIQAAGGMKFHSSAALQDLRKFCDRHGLLLIFDEIFTGFARTGALFACEEAGVVPDMICLSKALTGGTVPLAATVANEKVYAAMLSESADAALMHGPTYMAYPLGCAAANASLDLFEQAPRLAQVKRIESQLREELAACRDVPGVVDVRVKGAVGVVQMDRVVDGLALRAKFVEKGVWIKPFRDVVYLTPPLVIEAEELSMLTRAVNEVLRER